METTVSQEGKETVVQEEKKGKRKWLNRFLHFLMMGGWLLIVLLFFGMTILYYTIFPYTK